jgi:hypothetical protein
VPQFLQHLGTPRCCCLAGFLGRAELLLLSFLQEASAAEHSLPKAATLLLLLLLGRLGGLLPFLQVVVLLQLLQALLELCLEKLKASKTVHSRQSPLSGEVPHSAGPAERLIGSNRRYQRCSMAQHEG